MRDPQRINQLLRVIEQIWKLCPDMRLGQIIVNATGNTGDMFYYEDDKLIEDLYKFLASCHTEEKQ